MKYRVVRVLPSLLHQARLRLPCVLHEAVAVAVAVPVDPIQRALDVWPEPAEHLAVAGAIVVGARPNDEERCGIDAAVVRPERHRAQARHLAAAGFVQDLPGLGVLFLVDAVGLRRSEVLEDAARDTGVEPQRLQRGDDAVATERRAEPRDAGVWV